MNKLAAILPLVAAGLAAGCAIDSPTDTSPAEERVDTVEGAVCSTQPLDNAVSAMFANLASSMALEFKRMQLTRDLEPFIANYQGMLRVRASSKPLCGTTGCKATSAILAFQDATKKPYIFPNGQVLDPGTFAARLYAGYHAQAACEARALNGDPSACVAEWHYLDAPSIVSAPTTCGISGLKLITFNASKASSSGIKLSPQQRLADASKLERLFLWTDQDQQLPVSGNDFMKFAVSWDGLKVTFDPGEGSYPPPGQSGSCATSLLKFSYTNITGSCCSFAGGSSMWYQPYVVAADGSGYWKCTKR